MSRVDLLLLKRLSGRIGMVMLVFLGLFGLVRSLDAHMIASLNREGGPLLVVGGVALIALRIVIGTLPVPVVIGTILAVLDLQSRRELTVIKATGLSIWRVLRAPLALAFVAGIAVSFAVEPAVVYFNRLLPVANSPPGSGGELWLEQRGDDGAYVLAAERARAKGTVLEGVTVFLTGTPDHDRIEASEARLLPGAWALDGAARYRRTSPPEPLTDFRIGTVTTAGDMQVRFTFPRDLNFLELTSALSARIADPELRNAVVTTLIRQLALPFLLAGSVLAGFAFTSGYRRTNKHGATVLYGIVLGFVVYVVTELAGQSGLAGVLDPTFAAAGPAFVAIVIGLTVLLYREDGRT